MTRDDDQALRLHALDKLGALGPPLAREALESGEAVLEPNVLAWTGTTGAVHGHRVVLWVEPELCARVHMAPSAIDALTAAMASAVAGEPGNALAELQIRPRTMAPLRTSPYRGRMV